MGHSGFSEDQKQSAINLYKSGYTLTQVVNALGYPTIQSLTRWIENEAFTIPRRKPDPEKNKYNTKESPYGVVYENIEGDNTGDG